MRCNQWQPATSELKQQPFGLAFFFGQDAAASRPRRAQRRVVAPDVDSVFAKTGGGGGGGASFGMSIQVQHPHGRTRGRRRGREGVVAQRWVTGQRRHPLHGSLGAAAGGSRAMQWMRGMWRWRRVRYSCNGCCWSWNCSFGRAAAGELGRPRTLETAGHAAQPVSHSRSASAAAWAGKRTQEGQGHPASLMRPWAGPGVQLSQACVRACARVSGGTTKTEEESRGKADDGTRSDLGAWRARSRLIGGGELGSTDECREASSCRGPGAPHFA